MTDSQVTSEDQVNMLKGIALHIHNNHPSNTPVETLLNDYQLLHDQLNSIKVNWHQIADDLKVNRNKLYHWYFETHMRHLNNDKITKDEKFQMQSMILKGIQTREIEDTNFQNKIKTLIFKSKNIHRAEFSMTFNNLMRTKNIKQELQNNDIRLPTKRKNDQVENTQDIKSYSYANSIANSVTASGINSPRNEPVNYNVNYAQNIFNNNKLQNENELMYNGISQEQFQNQLMQQLMQVSNNPYKHQKKVLYNMAQSVPIKSRNYSRNASPPNEYDYKNQQNNQQNLFTQKLQIQLTKTEEEEERVSVVHENQHNNMDILENLISFDNQNHQSLKLVSQQSNTFQTNYQEDFDMFDAFNDI